MVFFSQEKNIWTKIPWCFFFKKKTYSWGDVFKTWLENTLQTLTNPYLFLSKHLQTRTVQKLWKKLSGVEMAPEMAQGQEKVRVFCFCFISIRWVFYFLFRLLSIVLMYLRLWVIEYEN